MSIPNPQGEINPLKVEIVSYTEDGHIEQKTGFKWLYWAMGIVLSVALIFGIYVLANIKTPNVTIEMTK